MAQTGFTRLRHGFVFCCPRALRSVTWNNNQTLTATIGIGLTTSSSGFSIGSTGNFTGTHAVTASPAINIS